MTAAALAVGVTGGCRDDPLPDPVRVGQTTPVLTPAGRPAGGAATVVLTSLSGAGVGVPVPAAGRVTVSVESAAYSVRPEEQDWVEDRGLLYWQTTVEAGGFTRTVPVDDRRVVRQVVAVPVPDRVAFVVTVDNRSPSTFRGRGTWMSCETTAAGRRCPSVRIAGLGLAAVVVPPGGRDRFTAYGPLLSDLPPLAEVGLRVDGLPPGTVAAGADTDEQPAVVWRYAYGGRRSTIWTQPTVVKPFAAQLGEDDPPRDRSRIELTVVDDEGNVDTGVYRR